MNGKKLTKAQIRKVEKIEKLFAELLAEGVEPLSIDGGGGGRMYFFRDADLSSEALDNSENECHATDIKISEWVP